MARQRIGGSRAWFAGMGEESGGSHTPPAPDLAASQAPTCEGVVGMISEMLVGRGVISCASCQIIRSSRAWWPRC
jgi:hypothetical protein